MWELFEHRANQQWKAHPDVATEQHMQKLLNSREQEQNGQIGTQELSQNVAGLRPSNRKGRGKWQGRRARMLVLYSRHGDSAAREMCGESTKWSWVWSAEESSQMEHLEDRRGKTNGDRATWGNCTAKRAKSYRTRSSADVGHEWGIEKCLERTGTTVEHEAGRSGKKTEQKLV
ncbi:hypothetical protein B0H14DRAFT_2571399 [Mycena olivaceomarginata]|nr:hypothetical protein B0H14DRAFT_2571399 [Mycena olivaceomarginata]